MEIVEFLQSIQQYVPSEYENIMSIITNIMPYIFLIGALAICFFGYKLRLFWARLTITVIAFFIGALSGVFFPNTDINVFIILGVILAIIAAYFSEKLHKLQIFIYNFLIAYIFIPNILGLIIPNPINILVGLILAIILAIFSVKYIMPITIIDTSIMGSFLTCKQMFYLLNINNDILFYISIVALATLGGFIQLKTNSKKIKEK